MLIEYLIPLTVGLVVLAVICVLAAVVVRRRAASAQRGMERLLPVLKERAISLPMAISSARAGLAEEGAAVEHVLWTLARFDGQVDRATGTLAERRASLDALRTRLQGARAGVARLKSAARLIMGAIELRRAFLG